MIEKGTVLKNEIRQKIEALEKERGIQLSTIQKTMMTIKGPITDVLDVLYGEVNLFMLDQHFEKSDEEKAALLDITPGEEIDYREVIIHKNGRPLVYAISLIPLSRCNGEIIDDLKMEMLTTGKIIDKHQHETQRVINKISLEQPTETLKELFKTDENMLTREYLIIHEEEVVIWTKEAYPLSYFRE